MLKSEENWGVVELSYQYHESAKEPGKLKLVGFQDFCPYVIDLEEFRYARESFTLDEWIDIILGAVDYNAAGYTDRSQKFAMLMRLLPFVEKRLNLIKLAQKGTGKSYLFGSVSRYTWLSSGGTMSRAKMFYDLARRTEGLVFGHDYVALDEVHTINFTDINEMRDEPIYRTIVDELVEVSDKEKADTRDTEAAKRICTAYLKLLFPHVQTPTDIEPNDLFDYCLRPAHDMRSIIKIQLGFLDPDEFGGKNVPAMKVRKL